MIYDFHARCVYLFSTSAHDYRTMWQLKECMVAYSSWILRS